MSALGDLLDGLDATDLGRLAARLAPFLPSPTPSDDGWIDAKEAAAYLGLPLSAIHKWSAARTIPCEQERPGAKLYFQRSALDEWRRSGGGCTL
jgi:excisionase family DNA binding protein